MKLLTCDDEQMPRSIWPLIWRLSRIYLFVSIPIVALFVLSSGTRFAAAQALARGTAAVVPITRVFCGDQFTKQGGVWGWRINANPFGTLNLASDNVTTWQVLEQVRTALDYRPKTVYLTAGRFDVDDPHYNEEASVATIQKLIMLANDHGAHVVITLAPFGTAAEKNEKIAALNERVEKECEDATILNLNNTIAPQGTLLQDYTADGVTLNEKAYDVWAGMVKATMAGGDTFRPSGAAGRRR